MSRTAAATRDLTDALSVYVREEIYNVRSYGSEAEAVDSIPVQERISQLIRTVQEETLEQVRRTLYTAGLLNLH